VIGAALSTAAGFLTGGSATRLAATGLVFYALGGWSGWQVQGWRQGNLRAQAAEQQARDTVRHIENRDRASTTYQTGEAHAQQVHTQIRERVRIINAGPGAAGQCLDADGLRELGAAIDNGAPTPAGPGPTLPTPGQAS